MLSSVLNQCDRLHTPAGKGTFDHYYSEVRFFEPLPTLEQRLVALFAE